MKREELIEELSDAIDDRMDMDVSYSMLAEACVDRLIALGVVILDPDADGEQINNGLAPKGN